MDYAHISSWLPIHQSWLGLLHRLRKTGLGNRPEPDWIEELNRVISELEEMNRSTESDFLAITGKLAGFSSAARAIAAGSRALLDSVAGERGVSACKALLAVLEAAREMLKGGSEAGKLTELREAVRRIRPSLLGFERVGPSFHVMATLARIETTHLGSAGLDLGHLADEFRSAGGNIRSHVDHILEGAAALERRIEAALEKASAFDAQSLKVLPHLVETAQRGLDEFSARREQSCAGANRVAAQSESFGKAIADIVASIQVHDMTRQQVEHAVDSLRQLGRDASGNRLSCPPQAAAVIELQLAQLANAAKAFSDAVHQMDQRLVTVADQVGTMAADTGTLLGTIDAREESTFFSRMENWFRAIADTAAGCGEIEESTRGALVELKDALEVLQKSIGEIHTIELRLRCLAINAAISAAHVGASGAPLEAVADAMRRLSTECEKSSGAADDAIHSIIEVVRSAVESSTLLGTAAGNGAFDQLRIEIQELHGISEKATERTGELVHTASRLSTEVADLRKSISAGSVFTTAIEDCSKTLRRIKTQMAGEEGPLDRSALVRLEQQYTMRAEREIHEAVVSSSEPPATPMPAVAAELGNNVELF